MLLVPGATSTGHTHNLCVWNPSAGIVAASSRPYIWALVEKDIFFGEDFLKNG